MISLIQQLKVSAGDLVTPAWQRMTEVIRRLPIIPGPNVLVQQTPLGVIVEFTPPATSWPHPFRPSLVSGGVSFLPGTLNGRTPTIKGEPMDGNKAGVIPVLKVTPREADPATHRSWVMLAVETNAEGQPPEKDGLEIVHMPTLRRRTSVDGKEIGYQPLAMLLWKGENPSEIRPIVMHHLNYTRTLPDDGQGAARHYFWAV